MRDGRQICRNWVHFASKSTLSPPGITHAIALDNNISQAFSKAQGEGKTSTLEYKVFDVEDTAEANIKQYFNDAVEFILEAKNHGYVLIHWLV